MTKMMIQMKLSLMMRRESKGLLLKGVLLMSVLCPSLTRLELDWLRNLFHFCCQFAYVKNGISKIAVYSLNVCLNEIQV